ncbi:MAG: HAD family phosphatase [Spirochaetaceae bacterium]|nr:HAD family phosphatase [Spirochaetaceae bacterium]
MQKLSSYKDYDLESKIKYVFSDVDDTITLNGKLITSSLEALWKLNEAGIKTICVTGGSAGWADIYLRQWPIEAVVTESGALGFYRENGQYKKWINPRIDVANYQERKDDLIKKVFKEVPEARLSSDQFSRIYDIAFDHGSELPILSENIVKKIVDICKGEGFSTAVSSIHINAWFGDYDKKEGTLAFIKEIYGLEIKKIKNISIYCGDAPNDQVMFETFPLSFAPANIYKKENELVFKPKFVSISEGGLGFAEIVDVILNKNKKVGKKSKRG